MKVTRKRAPWGSCRMNACDSSPIASWCVSATPALMHFSRKSRKANSVTCSFRSSGSREYSSSAVHSRASSPRHRVPVEDSHDRAEAISTAPGIHRSVTGDQPTEAAHIAPPRLSTTASRTGDRYEDTDAVRLLGLLQVIRAARAISTSISSGESSAMDAETRRARIRLRRHRG